MSEHSRERWSRLQGDEFLQRLSIIIGWFENLDLMIGDIYIHEQEAQLLFSRLDHFDRESHRTIIDAVAGPGLLMGYLWGARVLVDPAVPKGHIAMVPEGMQLRSLTAGATFPIGWADGVKS